MKFCWATIKVSDMDRSISFYQDIVGLKLDRRAKLGDDKELAFLGCGGTQVELVYNKNKKEFTFGQDISLGFEIESADQHIALLKSKNIDIQSGPFQPNPRIKFFYIQDPDGVLIQFVEIIKP